MILPTNNILPEFGGLSFFRSCGDAVASRVSNRFKPSSHLYFHFILALTVLAITIPASCSIAQSEPDSSLILARMKANDSQLVQIKLKYNISGVTHTKIKQQSPPLRPIPEKNESISNRDTSKGPIVKKIDLTPYLKKKDGPDPESEELAQIVDKTYDSNWVATEYTSVERLLVNDKLIAGMRWASGDEAAQSPNSRWVSDNGNVRVLNGIPTGEEDKKRWILEKDVVARPINSIQEQWMWLQFALGVGYGERIKSVSKIVSEGSSHRISGKIQIWWADESEFSILVDSDGIVREAAIHSDVEGNITDLHASSTGHIADKDVDIASAGTFTRSNARGRNPSVDFKVSVLDLKASASDEDKAEFLDLAPPPATEYQEINYDRIRNHRNLKPPAANMARFYFVGANIIIAISLSLWWFLCRTGRKAN